jgi:hypothetical protein
MSKLVCVWLAALAVGCGGRSQATGNDAGADGGDDGG